MTNVLMWYGRAARLREIGRKVTATGVAPVAEVSAMTEVPVVELQRLSGGMRCGKFWIERES
jgi:hypothetical protein